jgi:hypothetical protein
MNEWLSSNYVLELKKNDVLVLSLVITINDIKFSEKPSRPSLSLIDEAIYNKLNNCKNEVPTIRNWEQMSKLINPYEKIKNINNKHINYIKLYEIFKYIDSINSTTEAPIDFTGQNFICLNSDPNPNPNTNSGFKQYIKEYKGLTEETNDSEKVFLITAEGTVDTRVDPNNQEQYNVQIIANEIITAIQRQKEHGTLVLKIFDTITKPMFQLLILLNHCYKKVILYKPRTTRFTNAEKYVLCIDFKNVVIDGFNDFVSAVSENTQFCRDFGIQIDRQLQEQIYKYNKSLINNQIKYIEEVIVSQRYSFEQISSIEAKQNKRANEFCKHFGFDSRPSICREHFCKSDSTIKKCILCDKLYI